MFGYQVDKGFVYYYCQLDRIWVYLGCKFLDI